MPSIAGIRSKVVEIKKMVSGLYERLVILGPMIEKVVPSVYVPNIWTILESIVNDTWEEK